MNIKRLGAAFAAAVAVSAVTVTAFAEGTRVPINEKYFPDEIFREYVSQFDTDGNGYLSQKESDAVTEIDVDCKKIKSLKGVEKFTKLETLWCGDNKLTKLDLSKNTKLKNLDCFGNNLTELDLSKNTSLEEFSCGDNQLTKLDVSKNTKLLWLDCENNDLTTLDVSKNTELEIFKCDSNVKVTK